MIYFLLLAILFQIKHFVADYPLQTPYMLQKFKDSGWVKPLGAHAGVHALLTFLIALCFGFNHIPLGIIILVAVLDFIIHFIMDRIKASSKMLGRYKVLSSGEFALLNLNKSIEAKDGKAILFPVPSELKQIRIQGNKYFWWSLGLDQMVHHLTHYLIIFIILQY